MLKTKIFASGVNNLSDARYFAAWGADYIGFPLDDNLPTEKIKEMMDWVEGPQYIGEITQLIIEQETMDAIVALQLSQVSTPVFFEDIVPSQIEQIPTVLFPETSIESEYILKIDSPLKDLSQAQISIIKNLSDRAHLWLDIHFDHNEIDQLLKELSPFGLVIKGGEEEKIGLRNFDELDEIFEVLEA